MKLDEFRIGDHRAGARRHAQAFAARFQRIGGDGIKRAQAAGGEDHGAGAEQDQPRIGADAGAGEQAGDAAILHRQFDGMKAFQQRDRGRGQRRAPPGCAEISAPARSPFTCTMRGAECAASRPSASVPSALRSNGAP